RASHREDAEVSDRQSYERDHRKRHEGEKVDNSVNAEKDAVALPRLLDVHPERSGKPDQRAVHSGQNGVQHSISSLAAARSGPTTTPVLGCSGGSAAHPSNSGRKQEVIDVLFAIFAPSE